MQKQETTAQYYINLQTLNINYLYCSLLELAFIHTSTFTNFATYNQQSEDKTTVDVHGRYIVPCRDLSDAQFMSSACSRMGLIYTMRGLSALSVPTVGQCEGLDSWDGQQARFPRFFCLVKQSFKEIMVSGTLPYKKFLGGRIYVQNFLGL